MKLHQLQALVASADGGSIRAAARQLGLSQAAVTRALRELEQQQELPLLIRTPAGLGFTPYGKTLLAHARLVLNQLEQAANEMAGLRGLAQETGEGGDHAMVDADGVTGGRDGLSQKDAQGKTGAV